MKSRTVVLLICLALGVWPLSAQGLQLELLSAGGGYLGVQLREVIAEDVDALGLPSESGAIIERVEEDSPAAQAGLQKNDVITAVSGLPILSSKQLRRVIQENPAGRTVQLTIMRDGRQSQVSVELGNLNRPRFLHAEPEPRVFSYRGDRLPELRLAPERFGNLLHFWGKPRLGVEAHDLTPQMAEFLGIDGEKGVLVVQVEEGSAAAKAGLKAGDVIASVDGENVSSVGELRSRLDGDSHQLEIWRNRGRQTIQVDLEDKSEKPSGGVRL